MDWEVVEDLAGLERVRKDWEELLCRHGGPLHFFQHPDFVMTWWCCFEARREVELRVILGRDSLGQLVFVWPLKLRRRGFVRVLESAGGLLTCFDDVVVDEDHVTSAMHGVFAFLRGSALADAIHLRGVHEDSSLALVLCDVGTCIESTTSPCIDATRYGSFERYFASRSKRFRQDHKKSLRRLEDVGSLRFTQDDRSLPIDEVVGLAMSFKERWLAKRGLSGKTIMLPEGRRFVAELCATLRQVGGERRCEISTLRLDDTIVAVGIAFHYAGRRYEYFGAFDDRYESIGVGRVQVVESLRKSFDEDVACMDFLTPGTAFKERIADAAPVVAQYVVALSATGSLYRDLYVRTTRPLLKYAYRHLSALRRFGYREGSACV